MTSRLIPVKSTLALIDAQPAFVESMAAEREPVLSRLEHLLLLAEQFSIPCLLTFEHPVERKGWLPERLERVAPQSARRFVKRTYDLMSEPEIAVALEDLERPQLIVAGAETDVCVLQSVLSMLDAGYQVFLVEDCLFTAEPNVAPALRRMYSAGTIPVTYKTLYFELKKIVEEPSYHQCWNARYGTDRFVDPYDLS